MANLILPPQSDLALALRGLSWFPISGAAVTRAADGGHIVPNNPVLRGLRRFIYAGPISSGTYAFTPQGPERIKLAPGVAYNQVDFFGRRSCYDIASGGQGYIDTTRPVTVGASPRTIMLFFIAGSSAFPSDGSIYSAGGVVNLGERFELRASGNVFRVEVEGSGHDTSISGYNASANFVAVTSNGNGNLNGCKVYASNGFGNTLFSEAITTSYSFSTATNFSPRFGNSILYPGTATNRELDANIVWTAEFDRELSEAEIDAFRSLVYIGLQPANDAPFLLSIPGGAAGVTGTGALASQSSSVAGTGVREITATGALSAQSSAIAGTGLREITGTAAVASQSAAIAGTGTVGAVVTGTGALASQSSSLAGTGVREVTGTASLADQASSIAGAGIREITSTGALASQVSDIDGTGTVAAAGTVTGTGALAAQSSAVAGTGLLERTGTGALAAGLAVIDATGIIARTGTGALAAQVSAIAGTGIVFTPGTVTGTASLICGVSSISGVGTKSGWSEIEPESTTWTPISEASTTWTDL